MELSMVNWVVVSAGFLLIWASAGSAAPLECHFNSRALCVFAGKQYSLGESWMDDACMHCTCLHPVGVGCCETVHRPVDFPAWCEVRVEPVTCKVFLVQTADPRQLCYPGETNQDPSHGSLHLQQQQQQLEG
ncbi:prostate-associated microseminoprotein [Nothobranchius furzeri]|uniref:Prostate-associated microseminoprotein n=1 Tax=Nothobranchius furzeri TaxID=105023 RepID=A0A1A7ZE14_NOTFU|nr:prostate-associated microseminoprotein [Nothobranchius furzeri]KAF7230177.1 prostate associated [Nothobranchius furzeri]